MVVDGNGQDLLRLLLTHDIAVKLRLDSVRLRHILHPERPGLFCLFFRFRFGLLRAAPEKVAQIDEGNVFELIRE